MDRPSKSTRNEVWLIPFVLLKKITQAFFVLNQMLVKSNKLLHIEFTLSGQQLYTKRPFLQENLSKYLSTRASLEQFGLKSKSSLRVLNNLTF